MEGIIFFLIFISFVNILEFVSFIGCDSINILSNVLWNKIKKIKEKKLV